MWDITKNIDNRYSFIALSDSIKNIIGYNSAGDINIVKYDNTNTINWNIVGNTTSFSALISQSPTTTSHGSTSGSTATTQNSGAIGSGTSVVQNCGAGCGSGASGSGSGSGSSGSGGSGNDTGKYGYKMPQLNLYQKDYEGTSNIYSPSIYYNQEKKETFTAYNQFDDTYCKY